MTKKIIACVFVFQILYATGFSQSSPADSVIINIFGLKWMPDGKELFFNAVKFDMTRKAPSGRGIFKVNITTGQVTLVLKNAFDASISPNGKEMAFTKQTEKGLRDIYIYNFQTGVEKAVLTDTLQESSPSWSPDGEKLVYTVMTNAEKGPRLANIDLWVIDLLSGKSKRITEPSGFKNYNPVWAPEGDKIVYYLEKGDNRDQVYLTDENGSFHINLTADTTAHNFFPSWMGTQILYTNSPNRIVVMNQDGGQKSVIADLEAFSAIYDSKTDKIAFLTPASIQTPSQVKIFDMKTKTTSMLISKEALGKLEF